MNAPFIIAAGAVLIAASAGFLLIETAPAKLRKQTRGEGPQQAKLEIV